MLLFTLKTDKYQLYRKFHGIKPSYMRAILVRLIARERGITISQRTLSTVFGPDEATVRRIEKQFYERIGKRKLRKQIKTLKVV